MTTFSDVLQCCALVALENSMLISLGPDGVADWHVVEPTVWTWRGVMERKVLYVDKKPAIIIVSLHRDSELLCSVGDIWLIRF